jgi:hypothetical protein
MRPIKSLALAGGLVAAALVGGTLMSAVLAAPPAATTPTTTMPTMARPASMATYCQTFLDAFAGQLGTTSDKVTAAAKTAAKAAIDAAVTAGDLTAAQATAMKARIDAATGEGCGLLGHVGPFRGRDGRPGHGIALNGLVDAAATALKLSPAELSAKLRSGDSLKEVATAKGVDYATVSAAVTGALDKALAAAVTAGDLTQARADELRTHIVGEITDGTWPDHLGGRGPWGPPGG